MSIEPKLPPQEQYSILETFSQNTASNINQILQVFLGTPPIIEENKKYGNIYDFVQGMENLITLCPGDIFEITRLSTKTLRVGIGNCIINNVLIEIKSTTILDVSTADNYLFSGDLPPLTNGNYKVYVAIKYDPTEIDSDAYIGLINNKTYYNDNINILCFLGVINITIASSVIDITSVEYDDFDDEVHRPYSKYLFDGGWVGLIPQEYRY